MEGTFRPKSEQPDIKDQRFHKKLVQVEGMEDFTIRNPSKEWNNFLMTLYDLTSKKEINPFSDKDFDQFLDEDWPDQDSQDSFFSEQESEPFDEDPGNELMLTQAELKKYIKKCKKENQDWLDND